MCIARIRLKKNESIITIAYWQYSTYDIIVIDFLYKKDKAEFKKLIKGKASIILPPIH